MMAMQGYRRTYMIGIGGAGMSSLAEVLAHRGFRVEGCDREQTPTTEHLESRGITVHRGPAPHRIPEMDFVIYSSAVPPEHPDRLAAEARGIPSVKRAVMLGEVMKKMYAIGVAGTHGKSTTTGVLGSIAVQAGWDPTVIGGGVEQGKAGGARLGRSGYLIVEADEYDKSFLSLFPSAVIINNIDSDHLDCYGDETSLREAFVSFANALPFYGKVIANLEDPGVRDILPRLNAPVITYGLNKSADYSVTYRSRDGGESLVVFFREKALLEARLRISGEHNVLNALGAVAFSHSQGISPEQIRQGLEDFPGIQRRMQVVGEKGGVEFMDDYAHHPSEIKAVLKALRRRDSRRLVVLFQPHLYSRTQLLHREFAETLALADQIFLAPIYGSREKPMPGVDSNMIHRILVEKNVESSLVDKGVDSSPITEGEARRIAGSLQSGDRFISMGAGDVNQWLGDIMEAIS